MKRGKKYVEAAKLVDRTATYSAEEAVALVKKASTAKFDETVDPQIVDKIYTSIHNLNMTEG